MSKQIMLILPPDVSEDIRKIAKRRGIKPSQVMDHALMLEYWYERANRVGDDVCIKKTKTGKIIVIDFPWPESQDVTPPATKPRPILVVDNPDPRPSNHPKAFLYIVPCLDKD